MKIKAEKYGVGLGPSLFSKRFGNLKTAAVELRRMILAGQDPRTLTIVPVQTCRACKGKGEFVRRLYVEMCPACLGFKYQVIDPLVGFRSPNAAENRELAPIIEDRGKVCFMSGPHTTAQDRRTWLIRGPGEPSRLVRIYPKPDGSRSLICDCMETADCWHAETIAALDDRKFNAKEK